MEYRFTHKVDSHHTNPNYQCLLFDLLNDPAFHYEIKINREGKPYLTSANWMPHDVDFIFACRKLAEVSPTFRQELIRLAVEF